MGPVDPEALLLVGRIWRPHGVLGEVKIIPDTDDPERVAELATLYVGASPENAEPFVVEGVRFQFPKRGPLLLVRFTGIADRDAAAGLRGLQVYADEAELPPLEDDEYYIHDLIGLTVVTDTGDTVGTIDEVMELPAHPVGIIRRAEQQDLMLPLVPAFIANIDFDAQRLEIKPIEGLLD